VLSGSNGFAMPNIILGAFFGKYKRMSFQVTKQMAQELGIQIYDWGYIYSSTFRAAKNLDVLVTN
jgi:hypothetical protein